MGSTRLLPGIIMKADDAKGFRKVKQLPSGVDLLYNIEQQVEQILSELSLSTATVSHRGMVWRTAGRKLMGMLLQKSCECLRQKFNLNSTGRSHSKH